MKSEESSRPEIVLLKRIIDDEIKCEEDEKVKDIVKKKAQNLYPLLSFFGTQDLDESEIKKKIKSLIEED